MLKPEAEYGFGRPGRGMKRSEKRVHGVLSCESVGSRPRADYPFAQKVPLHISASPQTIPQRQHQIEFVTTPATRAPCPRRTRSIPKPDLCSEACRPTWVTTAAPRAIIAVFNSGSTPPPDHGIFPCLAAASRSLHMRLQYRVFVGGFEWNKRHARY